jgi:hypothetical protein
MDAITFLSTLFGDKPDDQHILIWTLPDKRSTWCGTVDAAIGAVSLTENKAKNVYVGVGLSPEDYGAKRRCPSDKVTGIVGLWADIDIVDEHHKKPNLPPDEKAALELVDSMGLSPSVVIHSGHGIQAWWLFNEPWVFDDTDERRAAQDLSQAWTYTLRSRAKAKGWDVDCTFDLARVLRVPGTVNHKGAPVPVRILFVDDVRYDPSEFEPYLQEAEAEKKPTTTPETPKKSGALILAATADPPFTKFELLAELEVKFKQTWDRKRKDFQDQSPSSYDLSLATFAAMANWSDQEITDLLIAARRKHGDDLKLRQDYYDRTIQKARSAVDKDQAQEQIEELVANTNEENDDPDERRRKIIANLSKQFGVTVRRIVKYTAAQPEYRLETTVGAILLGDVSNLIAQAKIRNKIAAATGIYLPRFSWQRWDTIAQALLDACEEETLGDEATEIGTAAAWLVGYLDERKPIDDANSAVQTRHPFVSEGHVHIFGTDLRKWLNFAQGEKITAKAMGATLRPLGAEPITMGFSMGDQSTTRNVWKLPRGFGINR